MDYVSPLATWMASQGAVNIKQDFLSSASWGSTLILTGLATSMAVNALMTGLIVFKILKVNWEFMPTSVERTLGSLSSSSTEGPKLPHVVFIIIESGMVLFAIQLIRIVFTSLVTHTGFTVRWLVFGMQFVIGIHEMLNVITWSVRFYFFCLLMTFTWLGHCTNNYSIADFNEAVLRWRRVLQGSCWKSSF